MKKRIGLNFFDLMVMKYLQRNRAKAQAIIRQAFDVHLHKNPVRKKEVRESGE